MDLTITLVICSLFLIFILKAIARRRARKSIPGPRLSLPVLGHLHLLGVEPWVTFTEWKKIYGPVFAIKMGVYDVIVLNESKLIKEAFGRPECNGRPPFELAKNSNHGKGIISSDGPLVAEQRNFSKKSLRGFGFRTNLFQQSIRKELDQVLEAIEKKCKRPVSVTGIFEIPVLNAIWNIFMGHRFNHDDLQLHQIVHGLRKVTTVQGPLDALAWFIPCISKYMPELSGHKKKLGILLQVYSIARKAFEEPRPPTRTFAEPQNFKEAFITEMERVGDNQASSFHPNQNFFQYTAGDILIASIELVSATLEWLLLYMIEHPEEQKKVQEEIDEKIGTTREPALSDKTNTPYIEAVIQEVLRFSSVAPLSGIMHRATGDTEIADYKINKDTLIAANIYGVHYDEDLWGDPENFRPRRFIDETNGSVNRHLMNRMSPFGTGIRKCSGEKLARDQLYLYCTSIFQKFNVSYAFGESIEVSNTVGFIRRPKDFSLTFTQRFTD